jgi:hypothetical protein
VPILAAPPGSDVKEAEDELKKAINASDADATDLAVAKLRTAGGRDASKALTGMALKLPTGQDAIYWKLVNGAASFRDDGGLEEVAKTILESATNPKTSAIGRDLLFALANNRAPKVATLVYGPILEKGNDEFKLMAANNICGVEFIEAVDVMIPAFKREEKKKNEIAGTLKRGLAWLTGATVDSADAFEAWWKGGGRAAGLKGREKREENTGTVVDELKGWTDVESLEKLPKERIVVLMADCPKNKRNGNKACNFDDMAHLLEDMKIPHSIMMKGDLESGKANLDKAMAVLVTCTQINDHCVCPTCVPGGANGGNRMVHCTGCDKHENVNHKLTQKTARMIRDWCERGGYVFSEDWGLADLTEDWVLEKDKGTYKHAETSWSKLLKSGKMMKGRTVPCSPTRGHTSHPLLRGVFIDPSTKPVEKDGGDAAGGSGDGGTVVREPANIDHVKIERNWKIDDDSPYIEVVNKQQVTVLMESDTLAKEGNSAVAVTFLPAGAGNDSLTAAGRTDKLVGGRVLHVLSHFGKQDSKDDEFALQNLLLNFLMEANKRYKAPKN